MRFDVPAVSALCGVLALVAAVTAGAAETLFLHPPDSQQLDFEALSHIVEEESDLRLLADPSDEKGDDPLDSLLDGSADLAIVENTVPFVEGVQTILPLYQGVVHLSARRDFHIEDYRGRDRQPRIEIVHNSHTAGLVADLISRRSPRISSGFQRWEPGDSERPDLQLYVGPINPGNTDWFREGFTLVPLGSIDDAGAEFYIEGVTYLVPQLQPTRIPALTYTLPGNEQGIDALAVDMLLVAHRRIESEVAYALMGALLEQKPRFAAVEPALFRWIRSDFEDDGLAFPLHPGARRYLERDEPGFLERYAETMNFLVYVTVLVASGVIGLGRWRARRRKDRIDAFYLRVLDLRREVAFRPAADLLHDLEALETQAFEALVAERLGADDSFRIFTELVNSLRVELQGARD